MGLTAFDILDSMKGAAGWVRPRSYEVVDLQVCRALRSLIIYHYGCTEVDKLNALESGLALECPNLYYKMYIATCRSLSHSSLGVGTIQKQA